MAAIYRGGYWEPIRGDLLPAGPDYATFDAGVNSGVSRASRWLQRAVGAKQDGRVGTLDTVPRARAADPVRTAREICRLRLSFMQGLTIWRTFGRGWARRVADVEVVAVQLAMAAAGATAAAVAAEAAEEAGRASRAEAVATKNAARTAMTGAGSGVGSGTITAVEPAGDLSAIPAWVMAVMAVILFGAAAVLLWRARIQKARMQAYLDMGKGSA